MVIDAGMTLGSLEEAMGSGESGENRTAVAGKIREDQQVQEK